MEDERTEITEEENDLPFDADENDPEWDAVSWGSDTSDTGEEPEDESDEADQPEEDKSDESAAEPEDNPEPEAEDADQWLELKHMDDEPRKVSKEEAKALAQKGLDYDRIRQERDDLKSRLPRYEEMEKFLQEMQGDFETLEDFMDDTRARVRADAEGISYDEALSAVKSNRRTPEPQQKQDDEDRINVNGFVAKYPSVKAEDIPESVWADVRSTGDLLVSYEKYDNEKKSDRIAELEKEIETLKNNKKNANRSTGSSRSSGASNSKSLIASLWDGED